MEPYGKNLQNTTSKRKKKENYRKEPTRDSAIAFLVDFIQLGHQIR